MLRANRSLWGPVLRTANAHLRCFCSASKPPPPPPTTPTTSPSSTSTVSEELTGSHSPSGEGTTTSEDADATGRQLIDVDPEKKLSAKERHKLMFKQRFIPLSERLHPNQRVSNLDSQRGVDQFLDIENSAGARRTGRAWRTSELRLKSFDDLHRLWFVLLKERNVLLTEKAWCRTNGKYWTNGVSNMTKVRMSMARLKGVVAERTRAEQHTRWRQDDKDIAAMDKEFEHRFAFQYDDDGRAIKPTKKDVQEEKQRRTEYYKEKNPKWIQNWMFENEVSQSRRRKWLQRTNPEILENRKKTKQLLKTFPKYSPE